MSSRLQNIQFSALARAGEGLTQWRPLAMGFITLVACGLLVFVNQALARGMGGFAGVLLFGLLMLVTAVVFFSGVSAVGVMLMDKAQGIAVRGFADAAYAGLLCVPKFLGLALLALVATLLFYLVAAIIYFVCKIPVLGAVLAFVAHPVLIIAASALIVAWVCVVAPMFAPAVWSGLPFKAALASVIGIARNRLVEVVLMQIVLYIILMVITGLLFMGLLPASISLTAMGTGIAAGGAGGMGLEGLMYMGPRALSHMGMSGSVIGLWLGVGVLFCVIFALLGQVAVMGQNLVYLQASASIDSTGEEQALDGVWSDVRKRAEEAKERAKAAAERAKQVAAQKAQEVAAANEARKAAAAEQAQQQAALAAEREAARQAAEAARLQAEQAAAAQQAAQEAQRLADAQPAAAPQAQEAAPAAAPNCPSCHGQVGRTDSFCEHCGHKLKP
ncbi:zinc ribbon domain-containing protein [Comamonas aquatica]|uniref:zinc ribbon domain-containing protein n=1 Tax=Comamonas aquatica TaxID=225991 RepID=UPI00244BF0E7|nr:zinc ribbon domain-containing protein [Comamonas aquatica]MDH0202222.1 zinc ribbon domain-containing protein [Comamonas aquatica]MDH0900688.1 zinc ribbon domain-containing protein [Comamonas aquatica]MDH1380862.1 zinc ribbon domain-containing protein [Comamonas aquatica]MDH1447360.1 zinc ribbon domain-containing protein [Comamonas aquatica]MDH1640959.1 zinc ribbon domain-containing protein [Comamonas aquatica]